MLFSADAMRELIDRFVGRYQIWRDQQRGERGARSDTNPLLPLAIIVAGLLALDIYRAIAAHHIAWRVVESDVLSVAFLVFCVWRPHWAWIIVLIFGASMILESPWIYELKPYRYSARVRVISALFFVAIGVGIC